MTLIESLLAALVVSAVPTLVMFMVASKKTITVDRLDMMTAFAAGALVADAGHHLSTSSSTHIVGSIIVFFIIDMLIYEDDGDDGILAIIGDAIHNFTDGLAIASTVSAGHYGTVVAIIIHEIPHQLADFAMLFKSGYSVVEIVRTQFMTSLACYIGVVIGYYTSKVQPEQLEGFTAGAFLYLALSSLLPSVKGSEKKWSIIACFVVGAAIIGLL